MKKECSLDRKVPSTLRSVYSRPDDPIKKLIEWGKQRKPTTISYADQVTRILSNSVHKDIAYNIPISIGYLKNHFLNTKILTTKK